MARKRYNVGEAGWGRTIFAGVISLIYFFPVLWIILTAFKTHNDALAVPPKWLFTPTLDNFIAVFSRAYIKGQDAVDTNFDVFFFNSIFIAGSSVLIALLIGTLAAFGFSRYPLKGNDTYLFVILTTRMLPAIVVIHENRGLNPYIEDVARRLAVAGFLAFAPDALTPLGGYPGNDDEGRELRRGTPTGALPPLAARRANFALVAGGKYATAAALAYDDC